MDMEIDSQLVQEDSKQTFGIEVCGGGHFHITDVLGQCGCGQCTSVQFRRRKTGVILEDENDPSTTHEVGTQESPVTVGTQESPVTEWERADLQETQSTSDDK
ncbi:unnamed protein product [Cylicostephanus goldi]|uniref:Uncharacterized protein n=1 Tax=Cylicostephanus goldi TaxID=71465 RepID=A0A3P7NS62_CYLGO|nr:unnamed protein product [Cylicostephanus goldi]